MPIDFVKDISSDVRPENHEYQQIVDVVDTADSGETETSDIFGLDGNRDMTAEYGQKVFDTTLKNALSYITTSSKSNELMMQFQDADQMVSLPKVSRQSTSSQLFLRTDASGNNLIHLEGAVDNYGKPTGFLLVQEHDGNVTLIEGQLKWSMTSADPGYAEVMRVAEGYLQEYVNGLSALESSEKLSDENLHSIRKGLGEKSVKQARKQVKESLDTTVPVQSTDIHNASKTTIKMKPNPDTGEAELVSVVSNNYQVALGNGRVVLVSKVK